MVDDNRISRLVVGKDAGMWVFDGEEWTDEGGSSQSSKPKATPHFDEFTPELQVIEIMPVVPTVREWPFQPLH